MGFSRKKKKKVLRLFERRRVMGFWRNCFQRKKRKELKERD